MKEPSAVGTQIPEDETHTHGAVLDLWPMTCDLDLWGQDAGIPDRLWWGWHYRLGKPQRGSNYCYCKIPPAKRCQPAREAAAAGGVKQEALRKAVLLLPPPALRSRHHPCRAKPEADSKPNLDPTEWGRGRRWGMGRGEKTLVSGILGCAWLLCCVQLLVTPWIGAHQVPLSMRFSRQEYQTKWPCPPSEDLPDPGVEPASLGSPASAGVFFTTSATCKTQNQAQDVICSKGTLIQDKTSKRESFPNPSNEVKNEKSLIILGRSLNFLQFLKHWLVEFISYSFLCFWDKNLLKGSDKTP